MLRSAASGMSQSAADSRYSQLPALQVLTPTTGQTVSFLNSSVDQILTLNPAGALAALTITFPSDASSRLGQVVRVAAMQSIAALTLSGATILNGVTAMVSGDAFSFLKINTNTWVRTQ